MSKLSITSTLEELEVVIAECKQKAIQLIESKKQNNPNITFLCKKPKIYLINSRHLSVDLVLSPEFYDYEWQFDFLMEKLEKQDLTAFKNTIQKIIDTGRCDKYRFHPDVISILKELV